MDFPVNKKIRYLADLQKKHTKDSSSMRSVVIIHQIRMVVMP